MPGSLLHSGAGVTCVHAGTATPVAFSPRVTVSGKAIVTMPNAYKIAGCTFPTISSGSPPCATATWTKAATRVTSMGQPVLLQDSTATCIPTGTPLLIVAVQPRVSGM
jgi:hypothetical protein